MVSDTKEIALEQAIERHLTGWTTEELAGDVQPDSGPDKYLIGKPADFDSQYALDTKYFWQFLETTQSDELDKLKQHSPNDWQRKVLERFDRMIKQKGVLHLLKKGLQVDNAMLVLMYPAPLASSSGKVLENFQSNIFSITRQLRYSQANPLQEIDIVLFLNGLPLVTMELKNATTGQTARYHGQKQYREDRDATQPLLLFGRVLVHMAVDTDEVYMATKLSGKSTYFLPFNKGYNEGEGNPPNPYGFKTHYLWEQVFQKHSLANIIQHFMLLEGDAKAPLNKKIMIFPRYHQLNVVRKLLSHVAEHGVGHRYLIQHSAGSGKSNSITWAAYQLIEAYPQNEKTAAGRSMEQPLYDSVIVVTDRRLLDKQLRENIRDFSEVKNIVAPAMRSSDLRSALESGKKIIITTIQKFPFIIDEIADMSDKRFAVIIDEAHSSQSGQAAGKMNEALGASEDIDEDDPQDKILKAMQARKMRGNASYFAFTATPKNTTLEKFGIQQPDGSYRPFHLYSMKQAIEESFILNVLANYTTYKSYYEIQKSIQDNPQFDTLKAQKKLRAYVESSQQTINTKAEVMLDHFIDHVVKPKKLRGKAKGMVVTQNIEAAIRYYRALIKLLEQRGHPFKILIAFSGEKEVDGVPYTEAGINGFGENDTRDQFDNDEHKLLVVANKYLTGFDQPKLAAMYVDKKLVSVLAVQALSRLNRSANSLGKRTEDLFVLDFFNTTDDIKSAFDVFFTVTSLSEATDVNVLHELKTALDDTGVYEWSEAVAFTSGYFDNKLKEQLEPITDRAAHRFNHELELEHDDKIDIKVKAKQFVKIYGQMAALLPYEVLEWETLYWFIKHLIPKLNVKDPDSDTLDELLEAVDLSSYGLERTKLSHNIGLDDSETELEPQNSNPRGSHISEPVLDPLYEIIQTFNERWFDSWGNTPEEARVKFQSFADDVVKHPDFDSKYRNNPDPHTRDLAIHSIWNKVKMERRKSDLEFYKRCNADEAFDSALLQSIMNYIETHQNT